MVVWQCQEKESLALNATLLTVVSCVLKRPNRRGNCDIEAWFALHLGEVS